MIRLQTRLRVRAGIAILFLPLVRDCRGLGKMARGIRLCDKVLRA